MPNAVGQGGPHLQAGEEVRGVREGREAWEGEPGGALKGRSPAGRRIHRLRGEGPAGGQLSPERDLVSSSI